MNGKRNDPGKAQSINGCGAEVKYCSDFGLDQARPALFFTGARAAGTAASCGINLYGRRRGERWNREVWGCLECRRSSVVGRWVEREGLGKRWERR